MSKKPAKTSKKSVKKSARTSIGVDQKVVLLPAAKELNPDTYKAQFAALIAKYKVVGKILDAAEGEYGAKEARRYLRRSVGKWAIAKLA